MIPFRTLRSWIACLATGCILWSGSVVHAAETGQLSAELVIPPAETYVIGDAIPLSWRFHNQTSAPLAFMWEGCCRLNGRIAVTLEGQPQAVIPPGQSLSHMFARAERVDPGKPTDMATKLSDWIALSQSGTYQLQGRYTGQLPSQHPQVPRGLQMWTNSTETAAIRVSVLTVDDYLAQREQRTQQRHLVLELSGPAVLPKLDAFTFPLRIRNTGSTPQTVIWPDDFQLWMVNTYNQRLGGQAVVVDGNYESLTIPPGGFINRPIAFESDRIEGEALGTYRVFADLAARNGAPRVPSTVINTRWELSPPDVSGLLNSAAHGHRTGLRNAPLKLLRVYLGELGPTLTQMDSAAFTPETRALWEQLRLAAALKPVGPKPGRVELAVHVAANGHTEFTDARVVDALPADQPLATRLETILSVRRHLGWETAVALQPEDNTSIMQLLAASDDLAAAGTDLATPPRVVLPTGNPSVSGSLALHSAPLPANLILRARLISGHVEWSAVRRLPVSNQTPMVSPAEIAQQNFTPLASIKNLDAWLADGQLPSPQVLILADPQLSWSDLHPWLEPFARRGLSIDLAPIR